MDDPALLDQLFPWRPPPDGPPEPPFESPIVLTVAPPVDLPGLAPEPRPLHRLGRASRDAGRWLATNLPRQQVARAR